MSFRRLPVRWKITLLTFGIVLFSLLLAGIIYLGNLVKLKEKELEQRSMITARTVSQMSEIKEWVAEPEGSKKINPIVEKIRLINDVDYIVVMNMQKERLSHPIPSRIGTRMEAGDEGAAFAEHIYVSRAKGEQGNSIRAFVPIMNEELEQVGVVMVGNIMPSLIDIVNEHNKEIPTTLLLSLLFGLWGSWLLARHIKRQMFDLEPYEIARMLKERTAAFDAIHEGVIAIDNNERITIINDAAKRMLNIKGDPRGKSIRKAIPDTRLPEVLETGQAFYNREFQIGTALIMSTQVPIKLNDIPIGALAIFQDRTEVTRMAEELTGVRAFVDALRVQNHEHMNKLHTIAGLIQLNQYDKALDYVFQVTEEKGELTRFLSKRIHAPGLSGLLLGKVSRGTELGIQVVIDRSSELYRFPRNLDQHDLVVVIGNLIENAFDALQEKDEEPKKVFVSLLDEGESLRIYVEDNGIGIDDDTRQKMFERGFTTKTQPGRGIGLYLIQQVVEKGNGKLLVDSRPGEGTSITITFPMESEEAQSS
ncbi:MAG: sensor histidine kinase [Bacillaceae bacterium]|nr:sensor histidine kinase [Bacillaceae bacterium]